MTHDTMFWLTHVIGIAWGISNAVMAYHLVRMWLP